MKVTPNDLAQAARFPLRSKATGIYPYLGLNQESSKLSNEQIDRLLRLKLIEETDKKFADHLREQGRQMARGSVYYVRVR